ATLRPRATDEWVGGDGSAAKVADRLFSETRRDRDQAGISRPASADRRSGADDEFTGAMASRSARTRSALCALRYSSATGQRSSESARHVYWRQRRCQWRGFADGAWQVDAEVSEPLWR